MQKFVSGKAIFRKDYTAFPWEIEAVELRFSIEDSFTRVNTRMHLNSKNTVSGGQDLILDGKDLELRSICIDGRALELSEYEISGESMRIYSVPDHCVLETEVHIHPSKNTALEGLYQSGDFLLTQCEAEGFRKITWFPDRPDVMSRFSVFIEADANRYPVLLSNGNAADSGNSDNGRHWIRWEDPFPKPSYLFALVAGDLAHIEDHFLTRSGRNVTLRVYVEAENIDRCEHAMESLINAMKWDEDRFSLEYDLNIYNIVATNDFNMGAMENKSLNIFNSKYVLARPDTATDADYQGIEGVIGHEYFHNWTGNRVTCQDWFQLTLKEGLTVFRDEEFSADMQSRAVKRIQDVRDLRDRQFPEDAGPMAHPIRPDRYIEINNFYTSTVYQKGATIIRMYHTLLGEAGFQKGMRLYFKRHDGQAVSCDHFLAAMSDANDIDLSKFSQWYSQSGTPELTVATRHDEASGEYHINLSQLTPPSHDQAEKVALVIPFSMGLINQDGFGVPLQFKGESHAGANTRVLLLEQENQSFTFINVKKGVVPSLLRDFSAPVKIHYPWTIQQLSHLIAHDSDTFTRWEAAQQLAQMCILEQVRNRALGQEMRLEPGLQSAFSGLLADREADPALLAETMILPGEDYLAEQMDIVDVDGIHEARQFIRTSLANALSAQFRERYDQLNINRVYSKSPKAMARRSLKNVCLSYLAKTPEGEQLAKEQFFNSDNMTDSLAGLKGLILEASSFSDEAIEAFEQKWKNDPLVMDKWFAMQAMKPARDTVERVKVLMNHPAFSIKNPNKVRSLIGAFSMGNPTGFHVPDGAGYRFHADQIIALDAINPQVAARMASAFNRWTRYDPARMSLMKAELERIAAVQGLSPDSSEIINSALR
ncbi:MAG: aminopeptidase N [Lysobacterales bacterium]|jgi:aminopeptidase N